ncbi:PEP-CTERM sorting domain-containing protein [Chamaesiphon minutus]|uniref:PEP-CTERM putative exosortase interaction domain-containing protein n=1 Tax=Chamaesiphon minutus (strain ATCC 27169 / PCC 6605) TaxID=1173020 RepID=K9UHP4_CHAP6|nr:PEP-CTERM sorting domain-containing protein [Chamaesiphon minutus]AFY94310.1 PEP-CTERM putative exosortase interaction domain-containing protein [Chamaesiphon minutus PCC 6605]
MLDNCDRALTCHEWVNGNFTPGTAGQTRSSFFNVASTGWSTTNNGKLNFVVPIGTEYTDNLNVVGGRPDNKLQLYGTAPILSPDGIATWYVAADGDPGFGAPIYQQLSGLTPGKQYDVTFYQAAGQQRTFTGPTTERWRVGLDTSILTYGTIGTQLAKTQLSKINIFPDTATRVTDWEKQTLTFTANSASDILTFLAVGTPSGKPPFSLLSSVSVTPTNVPEPLTIIGTIVGGTAALRLRKKLAKSTKNA